MSSAADAVHLTVPALSYDAGLRALLFSSGYRTVLHSLFQSAVNVSWGSRVIGVHARSCRLPGTVQLEAHQFARLRSALSAMRGGEPVTIGEGRIVFDSAGAAVALHRSEALGPQGLVMQPDSLMQLRRNLLKLAAESARGDADSWEVLLGSLVRWYAGDGDPDECRPASVFSAGHHIIAGMIAACRAEEEDTLFRAAVSLIGLGIGLTPAGDDILTGFLAAVAEFPVPWITGSFSRNLVDAAEGKTHAVSYTYLKLASERTYSDLLREALRSAACSGFAAMLTSLRNLSEWGASSGTDTAFGLVLGLSAASGLRSSGV
jgi:hypothetical protein